MFMMCLCKCLIQSSCTDKGPWKTRSQNLERRRRDELLRLRSHSATKFNIEIENITRVNQIYSNQIENHGCKPVVVNLIISGVFPLEIIAE